MYILHLALKSLTVGGVVVGIEQARLARNYVSEVCAVERTSHPGNWTCDVRASPATLHVPMLPCNFIPVHARLYTGRHARSHTANIYNFISPFLVEENPIKQSYS